MAGGEYRHRVLLEDTNLVGNVYFTRYLGWQDVCRERYLADLAQALMGSVALIITQCSCDYLAEARLGDELAVRMQTARLAPTLVTLAFQHWRLEAGGKTLIARGEERLACVQDESGIVRPAPFPEPLRQALECCSTHDIEED